MRWRHERVSRRGHRAVFARIDFQVARLRRNRTPARLASALNHPRRSLMSCPSGRRDAKGEAERGSLTRPDRPCRASSAGTPSTDRDSSGRRGHKRGSRFVAGSIRERLGPPAFATQTAPGETAMPSGCGPTRMVAVTLFTAGSTRETVSSEGFESHTAPSPAATASGVWTLIFATMAFRAGSIRMSVDRALLMAQTAPSPTANGPPPLTGSIPRPTRIAATTLPPRGSAGATAEPVRTLTLSLERCMTSKTEPTIAATTDAKTTARRNRPFVDPRAGTEGAVTRSSSTALLGDSTQRLRTATRGRVSTRSCAAPIGHQSHVEVTNGSTIPLQ
jgi:hypothetical protein